MFVETDEENDEIIEPNECQSVTRDFFNIHGYPTPDPDENISGVDIEIYNVEIIKRNEMQIIIIPNEIRRISDLYVSISPLNSESTKMTIIFPPSVEIIDEGVFRNQERIKEVIFAEGLKRIENNAFYGCPELKELSIPDSVAFIGENAFAECSISKLSISDENSHVEYFRNKYGTEITELTLRRNGKNGIENLEYISTLGLPLLKKIRITGVPFSDEEFDRVKNLFPDITLINGKEQEDEKSDDPLTINDETWIIYKGVLYGSRRNFGQEYRTPVKDLPYHYDIQYTHEKVVVIPDGVIEIAPYALKEKYIGEIVLPNTLQIIGNDALSYNQIKVLDLPNSLKTMGDDAIYWCSLKELSIPKSLTSIGDIGNSIGRLILSDSIIDNVSEKRGLIELLAEAYEIIIINDTNQYMKLYELVVEHRNYWLRKITFIGADISWRKRLQMEFASKEWKRKKIKVECISEEDKKIISVNGKDIASIDDKDINILIARINRSLNALSTQEAEIIRDMVTAMIDEYNKSLNTKNDSLLGYLNPEIELSLALDNPKAIRAALLANLETILTKINYNSDMKKLIDLPNIDIYHSERPLSTETLEDKIRYICFIAEKYTKKFFQNDVIDALQEAKKGLSENVIDLSQTEKILEKDYLNEFERKMEELFIRAVRTEELILDLEGKRLSQLSVLISMIKDEISFLLDIKNKKRFLARIDALSNSIDYLTANFSPLDQELMIRKKLMEILDDMSKLDFRQIRREKLVHFIKNGLLIYKGEESEDNELNPIAVSIKEISGIITDNNMHDQRNAEIAQVITGILNKWLNALEEKDPLSAIPENSGLPTPNNWQNLDEETRIMIYILKEIEQVKYSVARTLSEEKDKKKYVFKK